MVIPSIFHRTNDPTVNEINVTTHQCVDIVMVTCRARSAAACMNISTFSSYSSTSFIVMRYFGSLAPWTGCSVFPSSVWPYRHSGSQPLLAGNWADYLGCGGPGGQRSEISWWRWLVHHIQTMCAPMHGHTEEAGSIEHFMCGPSDFFPHGIHSILS